MPRPRRYTPPDSVLHLVNRGNDRKLLFEADREYEEFLRLVAATKERCPMRVLAYCLMTNHWHMVVWPGSAQSVSAFCHRLCTVHAIRHRRDTDTVGHGHLYQHRYHSFVIESERQYFTVMRYVEANAVRAGVVPEAHLWRWSSLAERGGVNRELLSPGPLPLPEGWVDLVNQSLPPDVLAETRARLRRTRPYDLRVIRSTYAEPASKSARSCQAPPGTRLYTPHNEAT
jgi:putative transposase